MELDAFRKALSGDAPLPFFRRLERAGLSTERVEERVGLAQLAGAIRRCALCQGRLQCERGEEVDCPNEEFLRRAAREK